MRNDPIRDHIRGLWHDPQAASEVELGILKALLKAEAQGFAGTRDALRELLIIEVRSNYPALAQTREAKVEKGDNPRATEVVT